MRFFIRVVINAFSIWVVTLIPALLISVQPYGSGGTFELIISLLAVAAVFALVNSIIGGIIKVVAFPIYIITLGLITIVVNGLLLWITAQITSAWGWGLSVPDFWLGVVAALIIAVLNWIIGIILRPQIKK